jgi:hypothetical protein
VSIPGDLMMFVTVKIPREFNRKEAVNKIDAGREWMEPPEVVQMAKGKLKTFFLCLLLVSFFCSTSTEKLTKE